MAVITIIIVLQHYSLCAQQQWSQGNRGEKTQPIVL